MGIQLGPVHSGLDLAPKNDTRKVNGMNGTHSPDLVPTAYKLTDSIHDTRPKRIANLQKAIVTLMYS